MCAILLLAFFLQFQCLGIDGLAYTAMTRLEDLAMIEKELVQYLDEYIAAEKAKLEQVVKLAEQVTKEHSKRTSNDTRELYRNPVEVYSLIKRFVYQWKELQSYLQNNNSKGKMDGYNLKINEQQIIELELRPSLNDYHFLTLSSTPKNKKLTLLTLVDHVSLKKSSLSLALSRSVRLS